MPVYDYECAECGVFNAFRPMDAWREPCACPACGGEAPRAFVTAPTVAGMDPQQRAAIATNERSRHEPRRSAAGHGAGCSCCSGGLRRRSVTTKGGAKSFPTARPWMISH